MSTRKRKGKVIRHFTVEVTTSCDASMSKNSSNPYAGLSDEARLRDFIEVFSVLWAESCREGMERKKDI